MTRLAGVTLRVGLVLGVLGIAVGAKAQDTENVAIHGFGGWALGQTNNDNHFGGIASSERELDNHYFALNVAATPSEDLAIHTQAHFKQTINGQKVEMDYLFAQWSPTTSFGVRAGKIKNPAGLYTEIYDVGTLRPFYLLPPGRYEGAARAYLGVGVSGQQTVGSWELEYDFYGGQLAFDDLELEVPVGVDPATGRSVSASILVEPTGRDLIGGRLSILPPLEGLQVGVSFYAKKVELALPGSAEILQEYDRSRATFVHGEYMTDALSLRSEVGWFRGGIEMDLGYVEGAFKPTKHWQVAASYDWRDEGSGVFDQHSGLGFALNYWVSPKFVVKLNYYLVAGNSRTRPDRAIEAAETGQLDDTTNVFILGTQFSF